MTGKPTGLTQVILCPALAKTFAQFCKKDIPNLADDKTSPMLSQITPDKKVQAWHVPGTIKESEILKQCNKWGFKNIKLYPGDVKITTKKYVKEDFGSRISLLYLDVDNYDGTLAILNNLYDKVAKGGLIAFDEYGLKGHGESDAVDKFFKKKKIKLKSLNWANSPTSYIIKE